MPVTMREIDRVRESLAIWKNRRECDPEAEEQIAAVEGMVDRLLRQWWAQDCREVVTSAAELKAMLTAFGNVKFDLGAMRVDGDEARAEAKRLKALILGARVMHEAECVAADVLASRDVITKERDDWEAKFESREKDYTRECMENARLKRVHAQNTQGLQRALDTAKQETERAEARALHLEKRLGEVANECNEAQIKRDALQRDRGDQPVTREWVNAQIGAAIEKHCKENPHGSSKPICYR